MKLRCAIPIALAMIAAGRVRAQNGVAQDSTLVGIHLVQLNVFPMSPNGSASLARDRISLQEGMALELRKAGLRLRSIDSARAGAPVDAIVTVYLIDMGNCAKNLRMNVGQKVEVVRTGRTHQLATWLYEIPAGGVRGGNVCRDEWWADAVRQATDAFLTKWLDMNGR